jgi:hypothetical protein
LELSTFRREEAGSAYTEQSPGQTVQEGGGF